MKILRPLTFPLFSLFFCFTIATAQTVAGPLAGTWEGEPVAGLQNTRALDSLLQWEERVVLHTDRSAAAPGEYVYFKAYLTTGPQRQRYSHSGVLRVELLDAAGTLVNSQVYPIQAGISEGAIQVPRKAAGANYSLRAYTRWMQNYGPGNYFSERLKVREKWTEHADFVSENENAEPFKPVFYPEGGQLLRGINNKVVIRMADPGECSTAPSGQITNSDGTYSVKVQAYGEGFGMALVRPQEGETYRLQLDDGRSFDLPEVVPSGYSLQINNLDRERLRVRIQATPDQSGQTMELRASLKDQTIMQREITVESGRPVNLDIAVGSIPPGVLELALTDAAGRVWTRRPVLIEDNRALQISMEPILTDFRKGEEAAFRLRVTDREGQPVQTELSLSVADATLPQAEVCRHGGWTMTSNQELSRQERFVQDLRALTHPGSDTYPKEIAFPVQRGLELIGYAYDLNNELLRETPIQVMASNDSTLIIDEVTTDASGMIQLDNLKFYGELPLVFRTKGEDTRSTLVRVEPLHRDILSHGDSETPADGKRKKSRDRDVETTPWTMIDTTGLIALQEAVVRADKPEVKESPSLYNIKSAITVHQDPERPVETAILMSRIPGVTVSGDINVNPRITLPMRVVATGAPVLWVVDGIILADQGIGGHPFSLIPYTEIERIEFVVGPEAAIFGARGAGGAFLLYTRSGAGMDYIPRKEASLNFRGFAPRTPFSPELTAIEDGRRQRGTPKALYWNPEVQTDANGEAVVRFTSPADYSEVLITAMGVSADGTSGYFRISL